MEGLQLKQGFKYNNTHIGIMYDEEDCIESLREAKKILGHSPSNSEYRELKLKPSANTISRKFDGWNRAKEEAGLEKLDTGSRSSNDIIPKPDDVELPEGKTWEEMSSRQRWYYRNREFEIERNSKRKEELRKWHRDLKEELGCSRCDESHPVCIEFHHEGEKNEGVSRMVTRGASKDKILEEMKKCITLCANCHRKEHADGA